jgi:adenylate kinase family enzyme
MKKIAIVTSASGSGGTTVGREIATLLGVPFHELDALVRGPEWSEPDPDAFRARVDRFLATDAWVVDGSYQSLLGQSVLRSADVVVWLDLPPGSGCRASSGAPTAERDRRLQPPGTQASSSG